MSIIEVVKYLKKEGYWKYSVKIRNARCYNKKGLKSIIRFGKKQNGTQNYKCPEYSVQFVRTKGTLFYHKKLKKEEVIEVCRHLVETNSFRGIARQTKHNKNTICEYVGLIAKHCEQVNNFLINDVKLGINEIDEFWSYVKKTKKCCRKIFHEL